MKKSIWKKDGPWLITIPRCGTHWILGMMEVYFQKPYGPVHFPGFKHFKFMKSRFCYSEDLIEEDLMWNWHHDQLGIKDCNPSGSPLGDLLLYRNPVHYCYSNVSRDGNENRMPYFMNEYKRTFHKWAIKNAATTKTLICYDDMVSNPHNEFAKIVNHFEQKFDKEKFENAYNVVSKEKLLEKEVENSRDIRVEMLTAKYQEKRIDFENKWKDKIKENILTEENKHWLERFF